MQNSRNKIEQLKSTKLLQLWGQLPNPDHTFLTKNGRSHHATLRNSSYLPEVQAAILARESAVMGDPWEVISDGHATDSIEFIIENLKRIGINTLFRNIFHGIWYGYTILEHPMEKINGKWVYNKINSLPSDWFLFNGKGELIPSNHTDTTPLNIYVGDIEKEVELVQYRPTFTNPYGESLLARVFWSATWIRGDMELWISYLDRFGDDSIIGKMDVGDDRRKLQMLDAISQFKSSGAIVLEGTDELEVMKTDKAGSSDLFNKFYNICVQQINKLILGHANALDGQPGKLGNDQSLSIVRQDITQDDKTFIEEVINRLIQHLCLVNGIKDNVKFFFTPEKEDENQRIERDQKLVAMGFELSEAYIRKAYRFGDDDIRKQRAISDTGFLSSERQRNRIPQKATLQPVTNFSEGNTLSNAHHVRQSTSGILSSGGFENGKKGYASSTNYYKELDEYTENHLDKFKKPFLNLQEKILNETSRSYFWEDGFKTVILSYYQELKDDSLLLSLLNAHAIGQIQVEKEIKESANFAEEEFKPFSTLEESKKYYTNRLGLKYSDYQKLEDELKHYAFSVKGIETEKEALETLDFMTQSFERGDSFHSFKKSLHESKLSVLTNKTDRELNLIYRQNVNSAYHYGRYNSMIRSSERYPYWQYITVGDKKVRPSHAGVNGTVRRFDDPFWNIWFPPNGFGCRCVARITRKNKPDGKGVPIWNEKTHNKAFEKTGGTGTSNAGEKILPDEGFVFNHGRMNEWIGDKTGILTLMSQGSEIGNRKQLIDIHATKTWGKTNYPSLKVSTNELNQEQAKNLLIEKLDNKNMIKDKFGNPVFVDIDSLLEHIEKKFERRKVMLPVLDKFFTEPLETWVQLEKYGKSQKVVGVRKYFLNVNNEPWIAIVEYPRVNIKTGEDISGLPVLTTIYPLNIDNIELKRNGVHLK